MELGEFQKKWLADLRAYPERQFKNTMGVKKEDGSLHLCCLGQAYCTWAEMNNKEVFWIKSKDTDVLLELIGDKNNSRVINSLTSQMVLDLGFRTTLGGTARTFKAGGKVWISLASANDQGISWPEIADAVEADPSNFFTKSV